LLLALGSSYGGGMWSAAVLLTLAAAGVRVEGGTACPAPADVQTRLRALLPGAEAPTSADADVARIVDSQGAVRITLLAPDGTTLGERSLAGGFPCPDLAAAAALVVATWETDVHPEFAARLEVAPPAPVPPPAPTVVRAAPPAPAPQSAWTLGAGVFATLAPSGGEASPAGGATLEGGWLGAGARWGARLALAATTSRTLALPSGDVDWRRATASAGVLWRLTATGRSAAVDLRADAVFAWISMVGNGFANNYEPAAFDAGAGLAGRLSLGRGPLRPWLELGGVAWPRGQVVFERPSGASAELPRWEAGLALGVSTRLGP